MCLEGDYYCFLLDSMKVVVTSHKSSSEFRQVIRPLLSESTTLYVFDCFTNSKPDYVSLRSKLVVLTSPNDIATCTPENRPILTVREFVSSRLDLLHSFEQQATLPINTIHQ